MDAIDYFFLHFDNEEKVAVFKLKRIRIRVTAPKKSRPFSEMEYPSCNTNMKQKEEQQHRQQKNNDELPDTD